MKKEEVKRLLEEAREDSCFSWKLLEVGVFSYNGHLEGYITWRGQGENEIVYNKKYDDIVDLTDLSNTFKYDIDTAVDIAMERIEDLQL